MAYQIRWETFNHHVSVFTAIFCYLLVFGSMVESLISTGMLLPWDRLITFVAFSSGPYILFSMLIFTYPLKKHIKRLENGEQIQLSETDNQKLKGIITIINSPIYKSLVIIPLVLMMGVAIWIDFESTPANSIWNALQIPYFLFVTGLVGGSIYLRCRIVDILSD